ncbi:DgaE family pyridoxal phosphate-dependent ammonia lyase [soil metagenome]
MSIYDDLGVRTVINGSGSLTRLGGTRMEPETLAAMAEAAASFVRIDDLQARAGEIIAEVTGAESGYVVTGAAAGLALGIAACIAGFDVAKMDQLPDTTGLKNEVVVQRSHRNAYDHAIRMAGVKFVEVGYPVYPGAGGTFAWQLEHAINERTAAIACPDLDAPGTLSLAEVAAIGRKYGVPVIVDAAASLPPRSNLRRFIAEGADLVTYSGGKAIRGPQASGVLAGRSDRIASVALQHQEMEVRAETWAKRGLLQDGRIQGVPHQGFGRAMKVGREEAVGLLVALKKFATGSDEVDQATWLDILDHVQSSIAGLPHITTSIASKAGGGVPILNIKIDEPALGKRAYDLLNELLDGSPSIALAESYAEFGIIGVNPHGLNDADVEIVVERLFRALQPAIESAG